MGFCYQNNQIAKTILFEYQADLDNGHSGANWGNLKAVHVPFFNGIMLAGYKMSFENGIPFKTTRFTLDFEWSP